MSCPNCPPGYDCERGEYMTDAELDAWLAQANADITAALDEAVDTEAGLQRIKDAAHRAGQSS